MSRLLSCYFLLTRKDKSPKTLKPEEWDLRRIFIGYFANQRGARVLRDITPAKVNDLVHVEKADLAQASRHNLLRMIKKVLD